MLFARTRPRTGHRTPRPAIAAIALVGALVIPGCGGASPAAGGRPTVVAAENFWGSIARQLAGAGARVQSVITNPAADPHSYEPTAADARTLASARMVLVNGVGYDQWATRLLAANPVQGRVELNVGALLGLRSGENPHRWYDPVDVETVARTITSELRQIDPGNDSYYDARLVAFENQGLARYHELIRQIRTRYGGVAVGASESIFELLSPSLGLRLITPAAFMKSITEGTDVSARDIATTERQLTSGAVKVWIYNAQNATPEIQQLNGLARQQRIPIATITETLSPANASFEQWQVSQLRSIAAALHEATGR